MFKIGYRTAKTALGTTLAIMLAQFLGLDNYTSAGIITILCIQVTKKKSLKSSWARFLACLIAMIFSFVFFEGIAYHPLVIGLLFYSNNCYCKGDGRYRDKHCCYIPFIQ